MIAKVFLIPLCASLLISAAPEKPMPRSTNNAVGPRLAQRGTQDKLVLCSQLMTNFQQCRQSLENISSMNGMPGTGRNSGYSGQAAAFKACMDTYRDAMIKAGC